MRKHHRLCAELSIESLECRQMLSVHVPALDEVSGAMAAFGLRQLSTQYGGDLIEVRRSSDGSTATIGFTASGDLDSVALDAFAGVSDVYVTAWFDQSGHGADLIQTDVSLQPQIVSAGNILRDSEGLPRLEFDHSVLVGAGVPISNQDLTAFFVQQAPYDRSTKMLLGLGSDDLYNHLQWSVTDKQVSGYVGDGSSWIGFGDTATLQPAWRTIQILDAKGQTLRFFRNRSLIDSIPHSKGPSIQSAFQVGDYSGYISEVILYPSLSDSQRLLVYDDQNDYFATGPDHVNSQALLPQDWQYQVDLYDWLETITVADVSTSPGNLQWDGSYSSSDELADLWLGLNGGTSEYVDNSDIIRAAAKWFVLDDGNGAGIEGSGTVKVYRFPADAIFWYTQDLSLAGGGQGNPYYQDPGLAMRALVSSAVDMVMHDQLQDGSPEYWSLVDFAGGSMLGWVWAYEQSRHLLDANTQKAFEDGFGYMAWKMLQWGAHDINGNIDTKAIAALAHVHQIVSDATVKDVTVRAARKILFGSETGTPDTTDYLTGLYRRAGYIDEGDSPETTYNGASLYYLLEAYTQTQGDPKWSFLDTVVRSMIDFKVHQYFADPDGNLDGPSGYAGRTGGSYVYDQRNKLWRDVTAAASFVEGRPLAWIRTAETAMVQDIHNSIGWYNSRDVGISSAVAAPNWGEDHWPTENLYFPSAGWYTSLKSLLENNDPTTRFPYQQPGSFNKSFDDEFWAYKAHDGSQDFGFFVETLADPGNYDGWYGGSLQTFWTRDAGMVILARHDKSGNEPHKQENTRVWSQIDSWATQHIWGRDELGSAFSTAATENHPHQVTYDIAGATPAVEVETSLGGGNSKGQQSGSELGGTVTIRNRFEASPSGLQITHTITSNGSDQIKELWATLPIYLRDNDRQPNLADSTIEYWDGNSWQALGTTLRSTPQLRLGRNFGSGPQYVYVVFQQDERVKLSASVWQQSYQGQSRIRNVHIDLHGNPGTSIALHTANTIRYSILAAFGSIADNDLIREDDSLLSQVGDSNNDGQFDQRDIVLVAQAAKYGTNESADWTEGDWNRDGRFDQSDIILVLRTGNYRKGPSL